MPGPPGWGLGDESMSHPRKKISLLKADTLFKNYSRRSVEALNVTGHEEVVREVDRLTNSLPKIIIMF